MQRTVTHVPAAWFVFLVLAALAGCADAGTGGPSQPAGATVPATSVAVAPKVSTVAATRVSPTPSLVATSGPFTLTLWIADDIAPGSTSAGRVLRNQFDAFTAANPDIRLEVVPRKASGKGGLLDLMLTTRNVVPARLPDLVGLALSDVPLAAQAGILQPLDGTVPTDLSGDFFSFAAQAAHYHNQWVAIPFAANVDHLVYNKTLVRQAPRTWDDLTKQKSSLLLPLAGDNAFLLQYLALGANLNDAADSPALEPTATVQVLNWFKRGHDLGLVPESAISCKTGDEAWANFAAGQVAMAQVSAARFMTERSKLSNAAFAPVPTRDGKAMTLATGWAFALVTKDPARQAATARFVQWIMQGERLAPWLRAARLLPTARAAVPLAVDPPDYATFIREELESAVPLPSTENYAKQSDAWRSAIVAVWKGQATAEEAARGVAGK